MSIDDSRPPVRRQIRLTEEAWRRLGSLAEALGDVSCSDAVHFLIRQEWKTSGGHPQSSQHRTDNVERLTLRVKEDDKKILDLIAQSLGGVSRSTVMRHLLRQWAAQQKEQPRVKSS